MATVPGRVYAHDALGHVGEMCLHVLIGVSKNWDGVSVKGHVANGGHGKNSLVERFAWISILPNEVRVCESWQNLQCALTSCSHV